MSESRTTVVVPLLGRGALPFVDLLGVPLYLHALEAVAGVGDVVVIVDEGRAQRSAVDRDRLPEHARLTTSAQWWADRAPGTLLVHDPLCPLTPPSTLRQALDEAIRRPRGCVVGFRPVTDTLKTVESDVIADTVDRETLAIITSPLAIGAERAAALATPPDLSDLAAAVVGLRGRGGVDLIEVPSLARRVDDEAAVQVLEGLAWIGQVAPSSAVSGGSRAGLS